MIRLADLHDADEKSARREDEALAATDPRIAEEEYAAALRRALAFEG